MVASVAVAAVACSGTSSSSSTTTSTIPALRDPACASNVPADSKVSLQSDLESTDERIRTVQCAINVAVRAFGDTPVSSVVSVGSTLSALAQLMTRTDPTLNAAAITKEMTNEESLVYSEPFDVAVNLGKTLSDASAAPSLDWLLTSLVIHDLYHTVQWTLLGGGAMAPQKKTDAEPAWLMEAAPAWFADNVMGANGYAAEDEAARAQVAARASSFPGLAKWENWDGFGTWNSPAAKLPDAVRFEPFVEIGQMLVERSSANALLYDYWSARAKTTEPWQTTFMSVFGVSATDFYAQAARHFADRAASTSSTTTAN